MAISQGDIYWVEIRPAETVGSEQHSRRPYVIVSRRDLNEHRTVVGVPLTTTQSKAGGHRTKIPAREISSEPGSNWRPQDSVALTDQVRVLDRSRLQGPASAACRSLRRSPLSKRAWRTFSTFSSKVCG